MYVGLRSGYSPTQFSQENSFFIEVTSIGDVCCGLSHFKVNSYPFAMTQMNWGSRHLFLGNQWTLGRKVATSLFSVLHRITFSSRLQSVPRKRAPSFEKCCIRLDEIFLCPSLILAPWSECIRALAYSNMFCEEKQSGGKWRESGTVSGFSDITVADHPFL
jgi:hypothetical protein